MYIFLFLSRKKGTYQSVIQVLVFCFIRVTGENKHYGTPTNPNMESNVPGGSSSGSAVAVAAELVDFALGKFSSLQFSIVNPTAFPLFVMFFLSFFLS